MRLIDADNLTELCDIMADKCEGIGEGVWRQFRVTVEWCPTIDAEPVRHGRWVIDDEYIDCSVCRREKWSRVPFGDLVKRFKYCPKCGAKMDGGTP